MPAGAESIQGETASPTTRSEETLAVDIADRVWAAPTCKPLVTDGNSIVVGTDRRAVRRYDGPEKWSLIAKTRGDPCGLAIARGRVFWTDSGTVETGFRDGAVLSARLDGTDVREELTALHGVAAMTVGTTGLFVLECGRGNLWRIAPQEKPKVLATTVADPLRYTHGCPDRGISAHRGKVAWLHATGLYELTLSRVNEDGSGLTDVASFDNADGIPEGVVLVDDTVYVYTLLNEGDAAGEESDSLTAFDVKTGRGRVVWEGTPRVLARKDRHAVWLDRSGREYRVREGRVVAGEPQSFELPFGGYALSDDAFLWLDQGQLARIGLDR